jgi:hypothetical protein
VAAQEKRYHLTVLVVRLFQRVSMLLDLVSQVVVLVLKQKDPHQGAADFDQLGVLFVQFVLQGVDAVRAYRLGHVRNPPARKPIRTGLDNASRLITGLDRPLQTAG